MKRKQKAVVLSVAVCGSGAFLLLLSMCMRVTENKRRRPGRAVRRTTLMISSMHHMKAPRTAGITCHMELRKPHVSRAVYFRDPWPMNSFWCAFWCTFQQSWLFFVHKATQGCAHAMHTGAFDGSHLELSPCCASGRAIELGIRHLRPTRSSPLHAAAVVAMWYCKVIRSNASCLVLWPPLNTSTRDVCSYRMDAKRCKRSANGRMRTLDDRLQMLQGTLYDQTRTSACCRAKMMRAYELLSLSCWCSCARRCSHLKNANNNMSSSPLATPRAPHTRYESFFLF